MGIITSEEIAKALNEHMDLYINGLRDSQKTGVRKSTSDFTDYLSTTDITSFSTASKAISDTLRNWVPFYYTHTKLNKKTAAGYINSLFNYMRYLVDKGLLPSHNYPRTTKFEKPSNTSNSGDNTAVILSNIENSFTTYKFKCITSNRSEFGPPHNLSYLEKYNIGSDIANEFKEYITGFSDSVQSRASKMLNKFFKFIENKYDINSIELSSCAFMIKALEALKVHLLNECKMTGKGISSFNDDWRNFKNVYVHLSHKKILPKLSFPVPLVKADKLARQLRKTTKLLSMSVRDVKRNDEEGKRIKSAYELASQPNDKFLEALERDERYVFDSVRQEAINEVRVAIMDYKKGQNLIALCDIDYLRQIYAETGALIDPNVKKGNQCLSFFSNDHPDGLTNLLGWIWHEHNGLALNGIFPGFNQHENHGGINKIKNYLGLNTNNATPFFIVIIGETAVNVSSLEKAQIKDEKGKNLILVPTENDEYKRFDVKKPRAKKMLSKLVKTNHNSSITSFNEDNEINAYQCLQAVIEMTAQYRNADDRNNNLWIGPYATAMPARPSKIGSAAFKNGMSKFVDRNHTLHKMDSRYITRANIRVSAGIIEWFESGGNMFAVAKKMGNSASTAMKNYIPQEIQDLLFRREMRRFQNLLILAATSNNTDIREKALPEFAEGEITSLLHQIRSDKSINEIDLYKKIIESSDNAATELSDTKITFVISESNIAILKLIADSIEELRLAQPKSFNSDELFSGQPLSYWSELWTVIQFTIRESPDRGLKLTYKKGIERSEEYLNNFNLHEELGK